jgi:hypothetical protein
MLNVIMLSVIMPNVIMLSVVILCSVMLNVVAPKSEPILLSALKGCLVMAIFINFHKEKKIIKRLRDTCCHLAAKVGCNFSPELCSHYGENRAKLAGFKNAKMFF